MISFDLATPNQMPLNPRLSENEKSIFSELKNGFERKAAGTGYFLIASSGTSQNQNESSKLIALKVDAVLNSARRVNQYLHAQSDENWGLALPSFHVAGLGVRARAFLAASKVFELDWQMTTIQLQLLKNHISYLSLVPAQVFDLVQAGVKAPSVLKRVFVGAGSLHDDMRSKIINLGWPVVETYGMTETASMIAIREHGTAFKVMPGIEVRLHDEKLQLRCNSMLSAVVQKQSDEIKIDFFSVNDWYGTRDHVELLQDSSQKSGEVYLELKGRQSDYIKVLGEGVSLSELRTQLHSLLLKQGLPPDCAEIVAVEEARKGHQLFLVFEKQIDRNQSYAVLTEFNLKVRPYEKLAEVVFIDRMPRTELGKLKTEELKRIIKISLE